MTGPGRDTGHHRRERLQANWLICAAPPSHAGSPAPPQGSAWIPIADLMPVAAALRELKQWTIDDPARRFDAQDWWYKVRFDAPARAEGERLVLGFDGLATVAQVWLNGVELLSSSNMFVSHECDVSNALTVADNELLICFSALDIHLAVRRKRPRWRAPMIEHQQLRWFRTTVLGRTPGWSPPAAVVGPWKDIWLERRNTIDVKNLSLNARVEGATGIVVCNLQAQRLSDRAIESVQLQLARHERVEVHRLTRNADTDGHGTQSYTGELRISDADLWWPHTHGEPALYQATLRIRVADFSEDVIIDLGRVGFRTISLDTTSGDFSLSVNGAPIFCRGACWTPLDPVTLRSCAVDCQAAVAQACRAGMNMLRVAGTTVYEEDHFFDACDEQGMLVWQDFMFANMDYPSEDAEFMASVWLEVGQQLRRLQSSACLALLCGNSEVAQQAAMWGAPREAWHSPLFEETLARLCSEHVPGTPYWPSSAHGGSFPHQANEGSTSYYGVGAYLRTLDDARDSSLRFASECLAFANIPASSAIERMPGGLATRVHHPGWKARSPRDLGAGWDFDDVRDHYLAALFETDPQKLRYSDHDRYLTLGRVTTGEVMAASLTDWRRPASPCRGALVLFLRDLWAGAGWGLIDDSGIPKACYHYLKRVQQPLTVLLSDEGVNGVFAHVINERGEDKQVELEVSAWRDGEVQIASRKKDMVLPARSARSLACLDFFEHFMDLGYAYRFGPMPCNAIVATLRDRQGTQIAQAFHFPGGFSARAEADVGLSARATMLDAQTAELMVRTKRLAQAVHFDIPGFQADDDYFHLEPNAEMRVLLSGKKNHPLMGSVCAVNSIKGARVELLELTPFTQHKEATQ